MNSRRRWKAKRRQRIADLQERIRQMRGQMWQLLRLEPCAPLMENERPMPQSLGRLAREADSMPAAVEPAGPEKD